MALTLVKIFNRAIQHLGGVRVSATTDATREAEEMDASYEQIINSELQTNPWKFAIVRAQIFRDGSSASAWSAATTYAANDYATYQGSTYQSLQAANLNHTPVTDGTADAWWVRVPLFGRNSRFSLPAAYVRMAPREPVYSEYPLDWTLEGRYLMTDDVGPLYLRYVSSAAAVADYDPLFAEAIAARMAFDLCETITNSETKKASLHQIYLNAVKLARQQNAIEAGPTAQEIDELEYVRW